MDGQTLHDRRACKMRGPHTAWRAFVPDWYHRRELFRSLVAGRVKIRPIKCRLDTLVGGLTDFTVPAQLSDTLVGCWGHPQPYACIIGMFDEIAIIPGLMKVEESPIFKSKRIGVGRGIARQASRSPLPKRGAVRALFPYEPAVFGNLKPSDEWHKGQTLDHKPDEDDNKRNELNNGAWGNHRQGQSRTRISQFRAYRSRKR